MRKRLVSVLLAVLTTVGLFIVAASPAGAAPVTDAKQQFGNTINFTGTGTDKAGNSQAVTGVLEVDKVVRQGNGAALLGDMTITDASDNTATRHVVAPAEFVPEAAAPAAAPTAAAAGPGECDVLNLVLGPLDLNLLGLEIHLDQVVLDIVADPSGGLLGQLLCALAGGPNGGALSGLLNQIIGLLNQILAGLG